MVSPQYCWSHYLAFWTVVVGHRGHLEVNEPGINNLKGKEAKQSHNNLHEQGGRLLYHQAIVDGQGFYGQQHRKKWNISWDQFCYYLLLQRTNHYFKLFKSHGTAVVETATKAGLLIWDPSQGRINDAPGWWLSIAARIGPGVTLNLNFLSTAATLGSNRFVCQNHSWPSSRSWAFVGKLLDASITANNNAKRLKYSTKATLT